VDTAFRNSSREKKVSADSVPFFGAVGNCR
jgi:hypothetical protein